MTPNRGTRPERSAYRMLFVGPAEWRDRVEAAGERVDGARSEGVRTATEARERVATADRVDCIVSAARLDGTTGPELAADPVVRAAAVPFVVAPRPDEAAPLTESNGDDVTWVVPLADGPGTTGVDGLATVLSREREWGAGGRANGGRASGRFDAVFDDPNRFVAEVGADGTVLALNDTAASALGASADAFVGKRLWALPWRDEEATRREVQRSVGGAADGAYAAFEAALVPNGESEGDAFEFRVQPVGDDPDRLVVQGTRLSNCRDVPKRKQHDRALTQLHRTSFF